MTTPSFPHWVNDLADSLAEKARTGVTPHTPDKNIIISTTELMQRFHGYFYICQERPLVLKFLINNSFNWGDSPEGEEFWQELDNLLDRANQITNKVSA